MILDTSKLPKPDYVSRDGSVVMYCGDCLDILPKLPNGCVDAVVTDPPYSSGGAFRSDRTQSTSSKYLGSHGNAPKVGIEFSGDSRDGHAFLFWCTLWMLKSFDVSSPSAIAMLFTDWRQFPTMSDVFQAAGWTWRGAAVWDKGNARPMSGRFSHQAEFILWGSKGAIGWDFDKPCLNGVQKFCAPKEFHQTEKPVELLASMIEIAGTTVLDPFTGSGTTGVACIRLNRQFIGIEKEPKYFDIAVRRIEQAFADQALFTQAEPPQVQAHMFGGGK